MARRRANKQALIRWKVYIDRARMYIGYIQFLMIGFVFLEAFKDTGFGKMIFDHLWLSVPIIFVLFIVLSLILGRLDTVLGLREEELRNAASSNPIMREIHQDIKAIKTELEQLRADQQSSMP